MHYDINDFTFLSKRVIYCFFLFYTLMNDSHNRFKIQQVYWFNLLLRINEY